MSSAPPPPDPWVYVAVAVTILDRSPAAIVKLAKRGHVRTHQPPGMRRKYLRADLERLAPPADVAPPPTADRRPPTAPPEG